MTDHESNPVGYCSPPQHSRFKKGRSGNPKGRPRKSDDAYTLLQRVLKRKVRPKGAEKQMHMSEALIWKLKEAALSGDRRALDLQREILDAAGSPKGTGMEPEEKKRRVLYALKNMGVKVIDEEPRNDK